jgi:hypothetical protein
MAIRCGRCAEYHETVQDVRACYNGQDVQSTPPTIPAHELITPKQLAYLNSLRVVQNLPLLPQDHQISKREASQEIDKLVKAKASKPAPAASRQTVLTTQTYRADALPSSVPQGRYAIPALGDNDLDFYKVSRPTEGQWAGRVFVKHLVGGDHEFPVRGLPMSQVLTRIAEYGVSRAELQYAQEKAACRFCNRSLTRRIPRYNGQGNDCADLHGLTQAVPPVTWRPEIQDEHAPEWTLG